MKKILLALILSVVWFNSFCVEPAYVKHDYIKGSTFIMTNVEEYVSSHLINATNALDSSYSLVTGVTNKNHTIQYLSYSDSSPFPIIISIPEGNKIADWYLYVTTTVDLPIILPEAKWWMKDISYTNAIPASTPTRFHFSQIANGIYIIEREELTETDVR